MEVPAVQDIGADLQPAVRFAIANPGSRTLRACQRSRTPLARGRSQAHSGYITMDRAVGPKTAEEFGRSICAELRVLFLECHPFVFNWDCQLVLYGNIAYLKFTHHAFLIDRFDQFWSFMAVKFYRCTNDSRDHSFAFVNFGCIM